MIELQPGRCPVCVKYWDMMNVFQMQDYTLLYWYSNKIATFLNGCDFGGVVTQIGEMVVSE
jgi:hypothetical protein